MSRRFLLAVGFVSALLIVATRDGDPPAKQPRSSSQTIAYTGCWSSTAPGHRLNSHCSARSADRTSSRADNFRRTCLDVPRGVSRLVRRLRLCSPRHEDRNGLAHGQMEMVDRWRARPGSTRSVPAIDRSSQYPPAGGKDVVLREWDVMLMHPNAGASHDPLSRPISEGVTIDATWEFRVHRELGTAVVGGGSAVLALRVTTTLSSRWGWRKRRDARAGSCLTSFVEPAMSLNRNVTVPLGRAPAIFTHLHSHAAPLKHTGKRPSVTVKILAACPTLRRRSLS